MPKVEECIVKEVIRDKLVFRDKHGRVCKTFYTPFSIPPGWRGGTAEQYLASAEEVSLRETGKRRIAADWILANKEIILNHHERF